MQDDSQQDSLNNPDDGICVLGRDGRLRAVNPVAASLLGYGADELLGRNGFQLFAPDGFAACVEDLFVDGRRSLAGVGLFRGKRGAYIAVSYSVEPLLMNDGSQAVWLRFGRAEGPQSCDIALQHSEVKLRAILNTIVDGVVAADQRGLIQLFNPAAENLFGYAQQEVIGRNVSMLMPPPDRDAHDRYIANYLGTGVKKIIGIGREVVGRRKDGSLFPLYLSIGDVPLGKERLFVAVLRDLTDKKRDEARLLTLSRAVEQSLNAVLISDVDGRIEYVNPSFTRLTGYRLDEVIGRKPSLLQSGQTPDAVYKSLWTALRSGCDWQGEIQDRKKNGELYWALETISPIRNAAGTITQYVAIQQDITELKRDKEALQQSEERFRQVAEMTGEWLWEQDPDGRYIYSSGAVRDVLGYEPEEILGKDYRELLTPADRNHWRQSLPPTIQKRFTRLVNRYRHRDGREVFTESTGEPIFDGDGHLVKWRGVDHNITSRKLYEDALRVRDRAIEAASVGIDITDARDRNNPNVYVNPALSRITGYDREELIGKNMRLLQGPDTDAAAVGEIADALREGRSCEVVLKNYRKDGTPFWNELLISPVRDESGNVTHYIGVQTDVTELRRASEEHHELEIAKQIQLSLLPKQPLQLSGVQVAGLCLPATHIGGDYYDYFHIGDTLDVVIADVSGHSVGAALIMAEARSALKAETRLASTGRNNRHGAAEIVATLNEVLFDDLYGADLFISLFYLRVHIPQLQLHYANAGHNSVLLLRPGAERCEPLDAEGMILGVRDAVQFEEKTLQLVSGDRLLLYTDGVTEAQNDQGEFFGMSRLCELFASLREEPPQAAVDRLLAALYQFRGGRSFNDDVSMVVLTIE